MDDVFAFCRKLRLKAFFSNEHSTDEINDSSSIDEKDDEKTFLDTKLPNPYFYPNGTPPENLQLYTSKIKEEVTKAINKRNYTTSNLSTEEIVAVKSLSMNSNIVIQSADKGGKIVLMNKADYVEECEKQLNHKVHYQLLDEDPTELIVSDVELVVDGMLQKQHVSKQDHTFITKDLKNPRMSVFYGLPKIHKSFEKFPPLRPIVSQINSVTYRLSKYLDSFLKFQARKCESFIRDSKHFLNKLKEIGKLPQNSILVTMDVSSLLYQYRPRGRGTSLF